MSTTVRRVRLPSGGWWDIETRPRWRHVHDWADVQTKARFDAGNSGEGDATLATLALASLTTAWSFDDPICVDSVARRDAADIVMAMEALVKETAALWGRCLPHRIAEELFASLAVGEVPDEFAEAHIMAHTGWSWETLQETPADVVERMAVYLAVKQARDVGGSIRFPERKNEQ